MEHKLRIVPWCGFIILNFGLHAQTRALTLTPNHFPSKVLATDWNLFCSTFLQNPYPSTLSTNEMCQFFQLQSPFASCKMQDWFTELMQHFKIVYVKQSTQMRKYLSDSFSFCLFRSVCLLVRGLKTHLAVHCRLCCTGWATPARGPAARLVTVSGWETVLHRV